MNGSVRPVEVAILAFPEAAASVIYGMFDLFHSAGRDWGLVIDGVPGPQLIHPRVVARTANTFQAGNGVPITPDTTLDACGVADIVCVPEALVTPDEPITGRFVDEIRFLQRCHASGATIATSCSAAILLAEAGLLDGHDATTHWAFCDHLASHYPSVRVHPRRALVVAGDAQRLVMAGGGTSWQDLALYLIARRTSVEVAMQVARVNLIDWHDTGQQPFACLARSRQAGDAVIAHCQTWIAQNYREPAPVARMARLSGLAERSFKRRFKAATGMSPLEYVHTVRLEEAKQMLESGDAALDVVALESGYEDAGFFGRLFRRHVGLTPNQYRRRFRGMRKLLESAPSGPG